MSFLSLPMDERMEYLRELLSCTGRMYAWRYDASGKLLDTNCPDKVLDRVFARLGCMEQLFAYARERREPLVLSMSLGLMWCAALEFDGETLKHIHVFGPAASKELSYGQIHQAVQSGEIPPGWRSKLVKILERIPVVSTIDFFRHALILHYCVTGQRLTNADITFLSAAKDPFAQKAAERPKRDRLKTWMMEQALMRMITEGDMNYKSILTEAAAVSGGVGIQDGDTLRHTKISSVVFISLCTRAAIQGGISPETAYSRGDAYIEDVLNCRTLTDVAHISHTMYEDFIQMVRKNRTNPRFSPQVQSCCDYIELHADEKLTLSEIAERVGYTDYYLSRKFKAETGLSINDYIKIVKVERAKTLLISTDLKIEEICETLGFGTRSFFSETFRKITGLPPAAFREKNQRI